MANKRKYKKLFKVFLTLLLLIIAFICGRGIFPAFADTFNNTDVLKNLQKDSNFKIENYPAKMDDYSVNVIQVAESVDGSLFLYTYQPCLKTKIIAATDINMSLSYNVDGTKLYELILINTNDIFAKYLVKDIKVSDSATRYYNITSVYRAWDKTIDGNTDNNNTGDKKAYAVRNIYRVTTENGEKKYYCEPTYTVNIINPYSDYLLYLTSSSLPSIPSISLNFNKMGMLDAHYIAFSTDWEIDRLKSATVTYQSSSGTGHYYTFLGFDCGGDISYFDPRTGYAYPTYKDKTNYTGDFWHNGRNYKYSWDRIQTVSEFLATEKNLTDETKNNLSCKQWVLRFLETERTQTETGILGYKKYTTKFIKVDKVSVLRLEFETDGVCYNLGAVSDMMSGDDKPGNVEVKEKQTFWQWLWDKIKFAPYWVWLIVGGFLLLILLPILGAIFPIVGQVLLWIVKGISYLIKYLFIGLWYFISAPFRFIAWLVKKIKGDS